MKPFTEIRSLLTRYDMTQEQLARRLGIGETGMSQRMQGKHVWTSGEMYAVMDIFEIPHERLHEIFPAPTQMTKRRLVAARTGA